MKLLLHALAALTLVAAPAAVAGEIVVDPGFRSAELGRRIDVGFDPSRTVTEDQVRAGQLPLEPSDDAVPSRGLRPGTIWGRVVIDDRRSPPEPLVLEQRYAQSDLVVVHEAGERAAQSGDHVALSSWPVRAREPAFVLPARAHHDIVVELRGDMTKQLPLALWSEASYRDHVSGDSLAQGLYFGSVFALVVYNVFLFVGTRQRVYGSYAATLGAYLGSQLAMHGVGTQYLWGERPGLNDRLVTGFSFLFIAFATPFFRDVLGLDVRSVRTMRIFRAFTGLAIAGACLVPFVGYRFAVTCALAVSITWCPTVFAVALREALRGDRVAIAVTLAWISLLGGVFLYALRMVGVVPTNVFI